MTKFGNKDLTLLLLVKDRPLFLKRWIKFHLKKNNDINLHIADGGKNSIFKEDLLFLKSKKNIKYYKYKYDKDYKSFVKKVFLALKKIKTKYVLFCSDDDFLNFEAIFKAKNILKKEKYLSAISGKYISFQGYNKFNRIYSQPSGLSFMYNQKCLFYRDSYKRVQNFFNNHPYGVFHYLMPTKLLKKTYEKALKSKIYNADLLDLFINIFIYSKIKIIKHNSVFHMHQYHAESEAHNRDYYILLNKKFTYEINEMIKILSKEIKVNRDILREDVKAFIGKGSQKNPKSLFLTNIKNLIINKLVFKFLQNYYLRKLHIEKENFKKKYLKNINDNDFIDRVYRFFV